MAATGPGQDALNPRRNPALPRAEALAILLALFAFSPAQAARAGERISGTVTHVADGDTLDITTNGRVYTVRLDGIDAPEGGQPFGREARVQLRVLALSREVTALVTDHDRFGRFVARVSVGGTDLSEEMVRSGFAWHYTRYSTDQRLAALEQQARRQHRGLWADAKAMAPWDYRLQHARPSAAPAAPHARAAPAPAGAYHGNTSSHVYHAPGCRDYDCPHCTESFMSTAAAEAAGYRPHEACVGRR
jgi:micrococcal nuclease